jgi:hypothetical protein
VGMQVAAQLDELGLERIDRRADSGVLRRRH